jgi:hypothetical protein
MDLMILLFILSYYYSIFSFLFFLFLFTLSQFFSFFSFPSFMYLLSSPNTIKLQFLSVAFTLLSFTKRIWFYFDCLLKSIRSIKSVQLLTVQLLRYIILTLYLISYSNCITSTKIPPRNFKIISI